MKTPICDFVREYAAAHPMRLHMPGHKGTSFLGAEPLDITEIDGADNLYNAGGVILQSEQNAGSLFGCHTFYSTEGSSHCIRAMVYLVTLYAKLHHQKPRIAAVRNAHKSFLDAAALSDVTVDWLYPQKQLSYASCVLSAAELEEALQSQAEQPTAVYVTAPDYLGNLTDIRALSEVCHRRGILLLVDNAHGAYLKFLSPSAHPMDLGADLCCDSAHKTLPVLTGGAYLHIARGAAPFFAQQAKTALALFGSTSPSYLILQSLDMANRYLADGYPQRLTECAERVQALRSRLQTYGYTVRGEEPLKLTVDTKAYGYIGTEFADILAESGIVCEFADRDFAVFMVTPEITDFDRWESAMRAIPKRPPLKESLPPYHQCDRVLSVREAVFAPRETIAVTDSVGRVLASAAVSCPPAVPIVVSGERIDAAAVQRFLYYGITHCDVIV